jgi:hypothetical protein
MLVNIVIHSHAKMGIRKKKTMMGFLRFDFLDLKTERTETVSTLCPLPPLRLVGN